jgi:hypothetical protein
MVRTKRWEVLIQKANQETWGLLQTRARDPTQAKEGNLTTDTPGEPTRTLTIMKNRNPNTGQKGNL